MISFEKPSNFGRGSKEKRKMPDTEIARKLKELVGKENPGTIEEVIDELKKRGVVKEPKPLKPFSKKEAERIIKAALGKDVFEREDKIGLKQSREPREGGGEGSWRDQQRKHLEKELAIAKENKDSRLIEYYKRKLEEEEIREQMARARKNLKTKRTGEKRKEVNRRNQSEADINEGWSEIYSEKALEKEKAIQGATRKINEEADSIDKRGEKGI